MALKLIASYSKRLGLPGYSSHQFSVSVEAELAGKVDITAESARLYETLQRSVDEQICQAGFVPEAEYGRVSALPTTERRWHCSEKQQALIEKVMTEQGFRFEEVEKLADKMFAKGLVQLNKAEASGLIDELFNWTQALIKNREREAV